MPLCSLRVFRSRKNRKLKEQTLRENKVTVKASEQSTSVVKTVPEDSKSGTKHQASTETSKAGLPHRRDLWQVAFEELEDDKKKILAERKADQRAVEGANVVQSLIEKLADKYTKYHQGGKGRSKVREGAEKTLNAILGFKQVVNAVAVFDPTGYASSAWTVISLVLQLAQNDLDRLSAVFEASGLLADVLARYANIEANYMDRDFKDSEELESTIIDVYVAVLKYSAEVTRQSQRNIPQRVLESFNSLPGQPLQQLLKDIKCKEESMARWRELTEHLYRKQEFKETNEKLSRVEAKVLTKDENDTLDWLSSIDFWTYHDATRKDREDITGTWLLEHSDFKKWKAIPHSLLWLYGVSGCGTTFLCSKIIDHLEVAKSSGILSYWYFSFSDRETQNMHKLFCSVIRQLCAGINEIPDCVRLLRMKHEKVGSRPSTETLTETLDSIIAALFRDGKNVFLVMDALDEFPAHVEQEEFKSVKERRLFKRRDILDLIRTLHEKHANLHVLVTSRDEVDIHTSLKAATRLNVYDCAAGDVEIFVKRSVNRLIDENPWKEKFRTEIVSKIMEFDEKRFRWASLQLRGFEDSINEFMIEKSLKNLPKTLEATYERVLDNIPKCYRDTEVAAAASLPEPRDVLRICTSSLVTAIQVKNPWIIDGKKEVVKFDHFSVKEYLVSNSLRNSNNNDLYMSKKLAHLTIARDSILGLLKTNQKELYRTNHKRSLKYSGTYWYKHVNEADILEATPYGETAAADAETQDDIEQSSLRAEELRLEIHEIFCEEYRQSLFNMIWAWADDLDPHFRDRKSTGRISLRSDEITLQNLATSLYYASLMGLVDNVTRLLKQGIDVNAKGGSAGTALAAAASGGHCKVLELLLNREAKISASELLFITKVVTKNGPRVLQMLLSHEPTIGISDDLVQAAVVNGDTNSELVEVLLKHTNDISISQDTLKAAASSSADMMRCLLGYGGAGFMLGEQTMQDVSSNEYYGLSKMKAQPVIEISEKVMESAVRNRYYGSEVVGLLLQHRPDIEISEKMMELAAANERCGAQVVELLLHHGGKISGRVMESAAANEGRGKGVMEALLQHRPDIEISEKMMELAAANDECGAQVVKILLHHGGKISQRVMELAAANEWRGEGVMNALLQHRPDIEISEKMMELAAANESCGTQVVEILLHHGGKISQRVMELAAANEWRGEGVMNALLQHQPDIEISEKMMESAAANEIRGAQVVKILLHHGGKISERVMESAAANEQCGEGVMNALLQHRPDIEINEKVMESAAANSWCGERVMNALLQHRPDIEISEKMMELAAANDECGAQVVEILLHHGGKISERVIRAADGNSIQRHFLRKVFLEHEGGDLSRAEKLTIYEKLDSEHEAAISGSIEDSDRGSSVADLDERF